MYIVGDRMKAESDAFKPGLSDQMMSGNTMISYIVMDFVLGNRADLDLRGDSPAFWSGYKDGNLRRVSVLDSRGNLPLGIPAHGNDVVGPLVYIRVPGVGELPAFGVGGSQVLHGGWRGLASRQSISAVPRASLDRRESMGKVFAFIGATIGGYAGWALGATVGFTTAFIISMVGTAIGVYYGRRIARSYLQ